MKHIADFAIICLLSLNLAGCGYTLAVRSGVMQGRPVDVTMFANRTYQPDIEAQLRSALVNELAASGLPVGDRNSNLVVTGAIVSLANESAAYSGSDKIKLYKLSLTVSAELLDRTSGKPLWRGTETMRQDYPANSDLALQANSRDAAVATLCRSMARVLLTKMGNTF